MEIKISPVRSVTKALIVQEGKAYYLVGYAVKRHRYTQGGFIMGSRSRPVTMWEVHFFGSLYGSVIVNPYDYIYGEVDFLDSVRIRDEIEKTFNRYKDDLTSAYTISKLKQFAKEYGESQYY